MTALSDRSTVTERVHRLQCAEWAAEQGWHVFPLGVGSKTPALAESWPTIATTDRERVTEWVAVDYNLGIACGPSGLVVVDEDEPGAFEAYAAQHGQQVPATFTVETGRGRHYYFRQPEGHPVSNSTGLGRLRLDVRGRGGYVVGPGSVHESGSRYQPKDWHAAVAPCPEWLVQAVTEPKDRVRQVDGHAWSAPARRLTEPAPEGERHDRAVRLAYWLRQRDLPYDMAELAMRGWYDHAEQPPTARTYYEWGDAERALTSAFVMPVLDEEGDDDEGNEAPLYADVAALLTGGRIDRPKPSVLTRCDFQPLLYAGQVNGLIGDSEGGKTWVALAAVAEVLLSGGTALVVDVDHNGVRAIVDRLHAFGVPIEILSDQSRFRYTDAEDAARLRRVVADAVRWKPDIALIDCVGEVMAMLGLNSNSPDDYTQFHTQVPKRLAAAGITTIIVDHLPKSPESKALGASGTHAKKRTVGGVMLRVKVAKQFTPGEGGSCHLMVHKDRHGGVRAHCPTGEREPLAGTFRLIDDGEGGLSWSISAPTKAGSEQVERVEAGVQVDDVAAIAGLDPPPTSVEDARSRLKWRKTRAGEAMKAWKEQLTAASVPGSRPLGGEPGTEVDREDREAVLMAKPLVCEVCASDQRILRFGEPDYVVRCQAHNPITWQQS